MPAFDEKSEYLRKLLMLLDLAILAVVFFAVVKLYPIVRPGESISAPDHYGVLPVILVVFILARSVFSRHLEIHNQSFFYQCVCLLKEVGVTLAAIVTLIFLLKLSQFSRVVLVGFGIGSLLSLILVRRAVVWFFFERVRNSTNHHRRVLIIGSGRRARMLADQLQKTSAWGVHIVGFLDPAGESAGRRESDVIVGHADDISIVLRDNVVEDVIVAVPRSMLGGVQKIIDACQEEGVRLRFMADIYDFDAARIRLAMVNGIPLLGFEPVAREENALMAKRLFDLVVTLLAMPLILPIFALVAVAIKLDSKGSVFFTQDRVGLHKRRFRMVKFRSMVVDAEERMQNIEHLNEADGPNFKIKDDPRITGVGRFLRKTSIDELPQLFNVIVGDMSLVGPRPMSVRDVNLFDSGVQRKRFSVRPGITCLWQVSGRSDLSFDEWLALDLEYIESWTFWADIVILLRTIPVVLKGSGAT